MATQVVAVTGAASGLEQQFAVAALALVHRYPLRACRSIMDTRVETSSSAVVCHLSADRCPLTSIPVIPCALVNSSARESTGVLCADQIADDGEELVHGAFGRLDRRVDRGRVAGRGGEHQPVQVRLTAADRHQRGQRAA